ncbi:hypothetical protein WP39_28935 [Streptomyces sp. 604F]|nr:hypothetical protein [Streptomyces sp. 604F]
MSQTSMRMRLIAAPVSWCWRLDQARRARRPVFWATGRHLAIDQVEVLDPHLPQDLQLRQGPRSRIPCP